MRPGAAGPSGNRHRSCNRAHASQRPPCTKPLHKRCDQDDVNTDGRAAPLAPLATVLDTGLEWDTREDQANQRKHGVSFEEAAEVFADPLHLSWLDERFSEFEERRVTVGQTTRGLHADWRSFRPTWPHRHPDDHHRPAAAGRAGRAPRRRTCLDCKRQQSGKARAREPAMAPPPYTYALPG